MFQGGVRLHRIHSIQFGIRLRNRPLDLWTCGSNVFFFVFRNIVSLLTDSVRDHGRFDNETPSRWKNLETGDGQTQLE